MFSGLGHWVEARWVQEVEYHDEQEKDGTDNQINSREQKVQIKWRSRRRPVLSPVFTVIATHAMGLLSFYFICSPIFLENQFTASLTLFVLLSALPAISLSFPNGNSDVAPFAVLLKSFNLCLASTVISITSLLNFSLAAMLAITLGIPLMHSSSPPLHSFTKAMGLAKYVVYTLLAWGWLLFLPGEVKQAVWNWEVLGIWFAPFICIVYAPLVTQAAIVALRQSLAR